MYFLNVGTSVILAIYADDSWSIGRRGGWTQDETSVRVRHEGSGSLNDFLELLVTRNREERTITSGQGVYIKTILDRFGMLKCNPISNPIEVGTSLFDSGRGWIAAYPSKALSVSGKQWDVVNLGNACWHCVWFLSHVSVQQSVEHYSSVRGQADAKVSLREARSSPFFLRWKGWDQHDRIRLCGFCEPGKEEDLYLDRWIDLPYGWSGRGLGIENQSIATASSTESENIDFISALQRLLWITSLLTELGREHLVSNVILEDNHGKNDLASSTIF